MNLVFSTHDLPRAKRYDSWRSALCDHYVNVDTVSEETADYEGFIREETFGSVTVTDTLLSAQRISRQRSHLARIDKDCFYLALTKQGRQQVEQHGRTLSYGPGEAGLFCASEPYVLKNQTAYRAIYLEFSRQAFEDRYRGGRSPLTATLNTAFGMGRVVSELCASMVLEANTLSADVRERLGSELLNVLAIAFDAHPQDEATRDTAVMAVRLRQVTAYIDRNIGNPLLNPERIAGANQLSVRALHYLFKSTGMTVSDWMWERRLERCRDELEAGTATRRTVTEIALAAGFNSMSHFSSLFRRKYGITPSQSRTSATS